MIQYLEPKSWSILDFKQLITPLFEAKVSLETLRKLPYQKVWLAELQALELKREVQGTTQIEGAVFTGRELDEALQESSVELFTRSQRQARAAKNAYLWIASLEDDTPISRELILELHRKIVSGADDDHCEPGALRRTDQNVHFGNPQHRGVPGGAECEAAFDALVNAVNREHQDLDPVLRAFAAHYHLVAMHPFIDGNGRTARALEALLLQRAGLKSFSFVSMSNYYYQEQMTYMKCLAEVRAQDHDLTAFMQFALKGLALNTRRVGDEILLNIKKTLYKNTAYDLFTRLKTSRKRAIPERQLKILLKLLEGGEMDLDSLFEDLKYEYKLKIPEIAVDADMAELMQSKAIQYHRDKYTKKLVFNANLDWPMEIDENGYLEHMKNLPKAKTHSFLSQ